MDHPPYIKSDPTLTSSSIMRSSYEQPSSPSQVNLYQSIIYQVPKPGGDQYWTTSGPASPPPSFDYVQAGYTGMPAISAGDGSGMIFSSGGYVANGPPSWTTALPLPNAADEGFEGPPSLAGGEPKECVNCGTNTAPHWRKDNTGLYLCLCCKTQNMSRIPAQRVKPKAPVPPVSVSWTTFLFFSWIFIWCMGGIGLCGLFYLVARQREAGLISCSLYRCIRNVDNFIIHYYFT